MEPVRDDTYEQLAATFQCIQIAMLNNALKQAGITDSALRQRVCESYVFHMGNFLDQNWFEDQGLRVQPLLCFSEQFLKPEMDPNDLGRVYFTSEYFKFHEYAHGNLAYYFEDNDESLPDVATGIITE